MMAFVSRAFVLAVALAAAAGCVTDPLSSMGEAARKRQEAFDAMPVIQPTDVVRGGPSTLNDGSLFAPASGGWSLFRDVTATSVGDIVTVRVSVSTRAEADTETDLSRKSEINAGITSLLGMESSLPGLLVPGAPTNPLDAYNSTTPAQLIRSSSTSQFEGAGDTKRSGTIVADISAVVTHVYANGNMRIFGSQSTLVNNENSLLTIEGVVRPADISADNVVLSDRIANAVIEVTGKGVVSDKTRPGIGIRLFDWFWPF